MLSKCISALLNWSFNWWSSEPPLYAIYITIILMYWKIVTNDLNFLLSLSVSVMKERLSWNWNMKARKKTKNSKLSFARKHGRRRNLGRQGRNTRYVSFRSFFYIGQVTLSTQLIKPNYLVQTGLQHHGKHRLKTWTNTFRKWLYVFRCVYCFLRYLV